MHGTDDTRQFRTPSVLLLRVRAQLAGEHTTLGEVLAHMGERAPGFLLLALAVPAIVPTPGLPAGMIFGSVLALVALQMMAGRDSLYVPHWIARKRVRRSLADAILHRASGMVARIEHWLAPRWPSLTHAAAVRPLGLLVLLMGVLIALPIPFGNLLPGLAVLVVALGLIARDGMAVAAGVGMALVAAVASVALIAGGFWMANGALSG